MIWACQIALINLSSLKANWLEFMKIKKWLDFDRTFNAEFRKLWFVRKKIWPVDNYHCYFMKPYKSFCSMHTISAAATAFFSALNVIDSISYSKFNWHKNREIRYRLNFPPPCSFSIETCSNFPPSFECYMNIQMLQINRVKNQFKGMKHRLTVQISRIMKFFMVYFIHKSHKIFFNIFYFVVLVVVVAVFSFIFFILNLNFLFICFFIVLELLVLSLVVVNRVKWMIHLYGWFFFIFRQRKSVNNSKQSLFINGLNIK